MPSRRRGAAVLLAVFLAAVLLLSSPAAAIRHHAAPFVSSYSEAPHFADGEKCPPATFRTCATPCDPSHVHVAMTLDAAYLRGSIAAVHSILKHADCPSLLFFHFVSDNNSGDLRRTLAAAFPSLRFKIYRFDPSRVSPLISTAVRSALEEPLNYARNYLADLIEPCVKRVVYLDSDVVAVDDVRRLYNSPMAGAVIAAPEYCHADFARYFTPAFWGGGNGSRVFEGRRRKPCYFNTGVMVMDLDRWRSGDYTARIEGWMREQREKRIYELGSLPPFLLVFAGEVAAVEHRWNQHGLGGDNEGGRCRKLHPGPVSLLHWSGKGKPWDRLDAGVPCDVDRLWEPYDLYRPAKSTTAAPAAVFSW